MTLKKKQKGEKELPQIVGHSIGKLIDHDVSKISSQAIGISFGDKVNRFDFSDTSEANKIFEKLLEKKENEKQIQSDLEILKFMEERKQKKSSVKNNLTTNSFEVHDVSTGETPWSEDSTEDSPNAKSFLNSTAKALIERFRNSSPKSKEERTKVPVWWTQKKVEIHEEIWGNENLKQAGLSLTYPPLSLQNLETKNENHDLKQNNLKKNDLILEKDSQTPNCASPVIIIQKPIKCKSKKFASPPQKKKKKRKNILSPPPAKMKKKLCSPSKIKSSLRKLTPISPPRPKTAGSISQKKKQKKKKMNRSKSTNQLSQLKKKRKKKSSLPPSSCPEKKESILQPPHLLAKSSSTSNLKNISIQLPLEIQEAKEFINDINEFIKQREEKIKKECFEEQEQIAKQNTLKNEEKSKLIPLNKEICVSKSCENTDTTDSQHPPNFPYNESISKKLILMQPYNSQINILPKLQESNTTFPVDLNHHCKLNQLNTMDQCGVENESTSISNGENGPSLQCVSNEIVTIEKKTILSQTIHAPINIVQKENLSQNICPSSLSEKSNPKKNQACSNKPTIQQTGSNMSSILNTNSSVNNNKDTNSSLSFKHSPISKHTNNQKQIENLKTITNIIDENDSCPSGINLGLPPKSVLTPEKKRGISPMHDVFPNLKSEPMRIPKYRLKPDTQLKLDIQDLKQTAIKIQNELEDLKQRNSSSQVKERDYHTNVDLEHEILNLRKTTLEISHAVKELKKTQNPIHSPNSHQPFSHRKDSYGHEQFLKLENKLNEFKKSHGEMIIPLVPKQRRASTHLPLPRIPFRHNSLPKRRSVNFREDSHNGNSRQAEKNDKERFLFSNHDPIHPFTKAMNINEKPPKSKKSHIDLSSYNFDKNETANPIIKYWNSSPDPFLISDHRGDRKFGLLRNKRVNLLKTENNVLPRPPTKIVMRSVSQSNSPCSFSLSRPFVERCWDRHSESTNEPDEVTSPRISRTYTESEIDFQSPTLRNYDDFLSSTTPRRSELNRLHSITPRQSEINRLQNSCQFSGSKNNFSKLFPPLKFTGPNASTLTEKYEDLKPKNQPKDWKKRIARAISMPVNDSDFKKNCYKKYLEYKKKGLNTLESLSKSSNSSSNITSCDNIRDNIDIDKKKQKITFSNIQNEEVAILSKNFICALHLSKQKRHDFERLLHEK